MKNLTSCANVSGDGDGDVYSSLQFSFNVGRAHPDDSHHDSRHGGSDSHGSFELREISYALGTTLKKKYTIIVVTHILRQARRLADYIVFMYMGDLIEHEPAAQFFSEPRDEKTRAYISGEIS